MVGLMAMIWQRFYLFGFCIMAFQQSVSEYMEEASPPVPHSKATGKVKVMFRSECPS
jgi:hypothetical protein